MQPLPDRLPLVIGVTGHRDLRDQDLPRLETEIAGIIAGLRRDYLKGDSETPIIVLSALAEGADRLVARVAIANGAHLIAPLPLPLEEYRRDFEPGLKPGNTAEFDALLAQATAAPVMPFTRDNSLAAVRADGGKRAEQYRAVGLFIVQHSNVLIAIWDGDQRDMAVGGTAEVVKFKRDGIPLEVSGSVRASLDGSELGSVIHVVAPRKKSGSPADKVSVLPWGRAIVDRHRGGAARRLLDYIPGFKALRAKVPEPERHAFEAWESFEVLTGLTREFNGEAASLVSRRDGRSRATKSFEYLFDDPDPKASDPARTLAPRWSRLYAIADTLAQGWQVQFKQDWLVLFGLAFVAFNCVAFYSHLGEAVRYLLIVYFVSYVFIIIVFARARLGRHQERFLDYRALAEALRVAVYWRIVGIGLRPSDVKADALGDGFGIDAHTVGVLANAYPIKQSNELAWVKVSLRSLELLDRVEGMAHERDLDPACHAIARRCWVHGQYMFFRRRGHHHDIVAEVLETLATVLLLGPVILLVSLLLGFVFNITEAAWLPFDLRTFVLIFIGLMPGSAAALTGYSERLALSAQSRQYDRMRDLFERAYQVLPETVDANNALLVRAVYRELGIEAMRENAEWVAVYRQRPIQPLQ
jgi:hypothetical protein